MTTPDNKQAGCRRPSLNKLLTPYCFGEAPAEQRRRFEEHLQTCVFCQAEVERLSRAVCLLRSDETIRQSLPETDVYLAVGVSAKSDFMFSGHTKHVLFSAFLYGLMFVLLLLLETSYEFDQLARRAVIAAPFVFLGNFAALVGATQLMSVAAQKRWGRLAMSSMLVVCVALGTLGTLFAFSILPGHMVTRNHTTGFTAATAYLKDLVYLLPAAILFVLWPFQFVVVLQKRLAEGRHGAALPLLVGERQAVPPRGVIMPSKRVLLFFATVAAVSQFVGLMHLLDTLELGRFTQLFVIVLFIRLACYFALIADAVRWYFNVLNEMLRECLAVINTQRSRGQPR